MIKGYKDHAEILCDNCCKPISYVDLEDAVYTGYKGLDLCHRDGCNEKDYKNKNEVETFDDL